MNWCLLCIDPTFHIHTHIVLESVVSVVIFCAAAVNWFILASFYANLWGNTNLITEMYALDMPAHWWLIFNQLLLSVVKYHQLIIKKKDILISPVVCIQYATTHTSSTYTTDLEESRQKCNQGEILPHKQCLELCYVA